MFILVPVVFVQTVLPLALSLSVDTNLNNYAPGNYSTIAEKLTGRWLGVMILIGALISQIGLTNGASLVCDEALQSFAVKHNKSFFVARARSSKPSVRWFFDTDFRIAPIFAFFDAILLMASVWVCTFPLLVS